MMHTESAYDQGSAASTPSSINGSCLLHIYDIQQA